MRKIRRPSAIYLRLNKVLLLDIGPPKPKCSKVGGQLRGIDPIAKCTICRQLDLHASSRARASNKSSCPKCTRHAHFMERPTAPNSLQKFTLIQSTIGRIPRRQLEKQPLEGGSKADSDGGGLEQWFAATSLHLLRTFICPSLTSFARPRELH